jgi:hypothetical protein
MVVESEALLALTEEKVIRRVVYKLSLTGRTSRRGDSPASGIQALDESGFGQQVTARGPLKVPDRLQQEALNRASVGQLSVLGSGSIPFTFTIHTRLLSSEPCHVAFPLRGTMTPGLGFSLMLWK